jgi:hypothetical protein
VTRTDFSEFVLQGAAFGRNQNAFEPRRARRPRRQNRRHRRERTWDFSAVDVLPLRVKPLLLRVLRDLRGKLFLALELHAAGRKMLAKKTRCCAFAVQG